MAISGSFTLQQQMQARAAEIWPPFSIPVTYLVIAGGGGGGTSNGWCTAPGGGAGGYRSNVVGESSGGGAAAEPAFRALLATNLVVTVGTGGAGWTGSGSGGALNVPGTNGGNSTFASITSIGGGAAAGYAANTSISGGSGGSVVAELILLQQLALQAAVYLGKALVAGK